MVDLKYPRYLLVQVSTIVNATCKPEGKSVKMKLSVLLAALPYAAATDGGSGSQASLATGAASEQWGRIVTG